MARGLAWGMLAALTLVAGPGLAPAFAQGPPIPSPPSRIAPQNNTVLPPEPEARADGYRLQGRCDVAIPIYRALVNQGTGYELAEFNLGRCLLDTAKNGPDPAAAQKEAAAYILKAANTGLPNAENGLVAIYLDGTGVTADPVEAAKWSLLYHDNSQRRLYRLPDVAPELQARLDSGLSEQNWAVARARAAAWSPVATSYAGR